jgi:hypothetical protein
MSESINVNKTAKQCMALDVVSSTNEDANKIIRITNMNNSEVDLFRKINLCFRAQYFSKRSRVFMPKGSRAHSVAFNNLSGASHMGDF